LGLLYGVNESDSKKTRKTKNKSGKKKVEKKKNLKKAEKAIIS
jgi:hypothetical protein